MNKAVIAYLKRIGKTGGQSKSAAKIAAAKTNGAKGGRPRKNKSEVK